jgi:L-ascorbate metabolism protein UlaG (beta-lactamase superfamily)
MKIKWLGHSCFMITSGAGIKIITDPYTTDERLQYDEIKESAAIVTVSHEHLDHNNAAAIGGNPKVIKEAVTAESSGIEFKGTPTYHDNIKGSQRGKNTIFCFEVDGVRICHLGDLGHQLDDKQIADLGEVDILLIPVGGFYTIDAQVATQVCNQIKPRVIIPMHYRTDKCSFPITGVDEFIRGKENVKRLDTSEIELKAGGLPAITQIIVLKSAL